MGLLLIFPPVSRKQELFDEKRGLVTVISWQSARNVSVFSYLRLNHLICVLIRSLKQNPWREHSGSDGQQEDFVPSIHVRGVRS